ncbi:fras1 related extracellular matrix protein [Plakobranchus ocellatus]|uniref:Fras1 related extracellular matrix protein n=1 Tax=Plakobranchus ocellatus TaxID=259542 RepID=A0AAV3Z5Y5_9GAST|nr:fras1 related extracellular matrix protein [Plakobranchus ocellatus]
MMRLGSSWVILIMVMVIYHNNRFQNSAWAKGKYSWMAYDHFDEINDHFSSINADNCRNKDKSQLIMRKDVVAQLPVYNELLSRIWYRNRSSLIHIHNMALNRAFFYSYVLQRMNSTETFYKQPNWMYFYFSATADVNANPYGLNGSAFYFDTDCHYPNWYTTLPFNRTVPLFGPKAFRWDDFGDQDNFLREPTRQVVQAVDLGAGRFMNYTHPGFKMNPWYKNWLPDLKGDMDSLTKFTYYIGIKESNVTGHFISDEYDNFAFFGPNSPGASDKDERLLPVQFTAPYFDCGGSNKWVVSAVSPVIDFMPRYSNFTHLRRQRIVGVTVMDTDLIKLDFNACGVSPGNPGPSYLSGIARCRPSTGCKHKMGYGFRRGGYVCVCKSGWRYPFFIERPFQGDNVEQATEEEYYNGFQCTPTDYRLVLPVVDQLSGVSIEGTGVVVNSAGLPLDLVEENERKRRETGNGSALVDTSYKYFPTNVQNLKSRHGDVHVKTEKSKGDETSIVHTVGSKKMVPNDVTVMEIPSTNKSTHTPREPTPHEMIALAEKIRELGESQKLQEYLNLQGSRYKLDITRDEREDTYAERNNVDISVEKEYEADVKQHKAYKDFLIEADQVSGKPNGSRVAEILRDDVIQMRERHEQRFHANRLSAGARRRRKRASVYDDMAFNRVLRIFRWKNSVSRSNCHQQPNHRLTMPGDVGYGADKQFQNEGRTAVRLSNFLSLYLQV